MQPTETRRALLLDAMGTLVTLEPPAPILQAELEHRFGIDVSLAQAEHAVAAEIRYYRAHMLQGRDAATVQALRRRCAEALRGALPPSDRLSGVDGSRLAEALVASLRFFAFDDARPALLAARRGGQRVLVVSNWDAALAEVLERVGLAPLLDGVLTSADAGVGKPARAIFEHALELAGVDADCALHVGDNLEEDVGGARSAGIAAIWLSRTGEPGPPGVRVITSLSELTWE